MANGMPCVVLTVGSASSETSHLTCVRETCQALYKSETLEAREMPSSFLDMQIQPTSRLIQIQPRSRLSQIQPRSKLIQIQPRSRLSQIKPRSKLSQIQLRKTIVFTRSRCHSPWAVTVCSRHPNMFQTPQHVAGTLQVPDTPICSRRPTCCRHSTLSRHPIFSRHPTLSATPKCSRYSESSNYPQMFKTPLNVEDISKGSRHSQNVPDTPQNVYTHKCSRHLQMFNLPLFVPGIPHVPAPPHPSPHVADTCLNSSGQCLYPPLL